MKVFRGGLACFALVYLGFAVAPHAWWVWPLMVVYGAYKGLTDGASRAVVFDLVPDPDIRGRALGTSQAVNGVCVLVSSLVAGVLYQAVSPAAPFVVGAVAGALAFAVLLGRDR
jgi:MFS family permease